MHAANIASIRLHHQHLLRPSFQRVEEVVTHMGAMQAQDYVHAKWAVGVRLPGLQVAAVEQALNEGRIIRTHVLRPTWHLIAAEDARWMLALSQPQVLSQMRSAERSYGLDDAFYDRAFPLIEKALSGGRELTRKEVMDELAQAGLDVPPASANHIMARAELAALVCNGIRRGHELTYALMDEKVPAGPMLDRPAAIARLAGRYFNSHAPATVADFQWWSGLKKSDARAGLEAAQPELVREVINGQEYWLPHTGSDPGQASSGLQLLPAFDELIISYTDRSACMGPDELAVVVTKNGIFKPTILVDGQVKGIWRRSFQKQTLQLEPTLFSPFSPDQERAYQAATEAYAAFCGLALSS